MMTGRPTRKPDHRPLGKLRERLSKVFQNRIFLGIVSLIVAFIIWAVLVASDGTLTRRKSFVDAPVSVTGETTLISRGYIVTDNILEMVPNVDMTVEITQANYDRVTASSYNPHFELSQITGEGENTLSIVYSSQLYGPVISCEPNTVTVHAERYITRRVPVVVQLDNTLPEGLYLDSYRTDPTTLSVSGPQSVVSTVSRVLLHLDQSALSEERMTDRLSLDIELQTADGTPVTNSKLNVTNQSVITRSVIVETELVHVKQVPLVASAFVTGEPAEGFAVSGVELASETLPVAASDAILEAITGITTDAPLDITGAHEDVTGYVRVRRITGIDNTLPTEIGVTVHITEESATKTFRNVPVTVTGMNEAYRTAVRPERVNVTLTGPYTVINSLESSGLTVTVSASGLTAGTHEIPLTLQMDNADALEAEYSTETAVLTITENQP